MTKDILIFDISGMAAHYRKFYTNSSSLSYAVPPRTALCGMIAAILGLKRDSYYQCFSKERMEIGVRKNNKTRRIMQSLNYMKITTADEFQLPKSHTQIPFELIVGESGMVSYRVYISHEDEEVMNSLEERLKQRKYFYPPYLGAAPFLGQVDYVGRIIGKVSTSDDPVNVTSVIPFDAIENRGIQFSELNSSQVLLLKERMPCEFDEGRKIKTIKSYILSESMEPIPVVLKEEFVEIEYDGIRENILFL